MLAVSSDAYEQWANGTIGFQEFASKSSDTICIALASSCSFTGSCDPGDTETPRFGVGTGILPGTETSMGHIVGSFYCGAAGGWVTAFLMGNPETETDSPLVGDETEMNIDTVLQGLRGMSLEAEDPYSVRLAVVERRRRLLERDVHPDRCQQKDGESNDQYTKRLAECTEGMQRLSHHYRVLVAFIHNRDQENWQNIRGLLVGKWNECKGSFTSGLKPLALCP